MQNFVFVHMYVFLGVRSHRRLGIPILEGFLVQNWMVLEGEVVVMLFTLQTWKLRPREADDLTQNTLLVSDQIRIRSQIIGLLVQCSFHHVNLSLLLH